MCIYGDYFSLENKSANNLIVIIYTYSVFFFNPYSASLSVALASFLNKFTQIILHRYTEGLFVKRKVKILHLGIGIHDTIKTGYAVNKCLNT